MPTALQFDMVPLAARSLRTMLDIADHLAREGHWERDEPIEAEVARTVKQLFDLLAWSDGKLDLRECRLLDRLERIEPDFGARLREMAFFHPADPTHEVIPPLLVATVAFDRSHGTRLALILVDSLEIFGYAVASVNGAPLDIEQSELRLYVDNLRALATMLA